MSHRKVVQDYYLDINNLADLLTKFTNSYRLLIGGAQELNSIALASKNDVKKALQRANDLGLVIDDLIDVLDVCGCNYMNYCKLKSHVVRAKIQIRNIETEIDEELNLKE